MSAASAAVDLEVGRRLPLADATLRLLQCALDDAFLTDVFSRHRGRCFERELPFPVFVRLMSDAFLGHRGSPHQTFLRAQEQDVLDSSVQSMYNRLATLPCQLSTAFFAEAAERLHRLAIPAVHTLPTSLADHQLLALDGKKLKYVLKRLKPLRGLKGNVLGGKLLVVQDLATNRALVVEADVDGEAADNPLVPAAVEQVRASPLSLPAPSAVTRPRLWVGDRGFCDFKTLALLSRDGDAFLIRHHKKCGFHLDTSIQAREGKDDVGRAFREEWGWLGGPDNKDRVRVRKITVERPGVSEGPLTILTSLMDADRYPAFDLLIVYRRRWGIETMFQKVVQTYDLRHLIGGTAQASVFQAVFCMLLYNITLIIRDFVAAGAERQPASISVELLHQDMVEELTAWMKVIGPQATAGVLAAREFATIEEFSSYLRQTLGGIFTERLAKRKTSKREPKKPPRAYLKGGHSSVDRILRGVHEEIPIKPHKQKTG